MSETQVTSSGLFEAVQAAMTEYVTLGRPSFLKKYSVPRSRQYFIRSGSSVLLDAWPVLKAARQMLGQSGGGDVDEAEDELSAGNLLDDLGFEVVVSGGDWTQEEVDLTVADYFAMLSLDARGVRFVKTEHNAALRQHLRSRSKASVELKHQNISAILYRLGLPFIQGYKPRGNVQSILRDAVSRYVAERPFAMQTIVDDYQETEAPGSKRFKAALVDRPQLPASVKKEPPADLRIPRKLDFAARDEANRSLGRSGEEWTVAYEAYRLDIVGLGHLASSIDWVADRAGDGAGYDIQSFETPTVRRYIEVKATNGPALTPFYVTRGELGFSEEAASEFWLYRIFDFRRKPRLFVLNGALEKHVTLEPVDYRARLKALG